MIHSIILAAGKGRRMHSSLPKVLQNLSDKPLLGHVLDTACQVSDNLYVVCGYKQDLVRQMFAQTKIHWVTQAQQLGTAHAVSQAMFNIANNQDIVLILYGDVPLIKTKTLTILCQKAQKNKVALLSTVLEDPTGYGRIVRDELGNINQVIEQKDGDEKTLKITEVNTGIMAIKANLLHQYLPKINHHNAQGELYLTDIIGLLVQNKINISSLICPDTIEVMGVNNKVDLAHLERNIQQQTVQILMAQGLTLKDPNRFDCRGKLSFGTDCCIDINTIITGKVSLGNQVTIEANCLIKNSKIGDNSIIYANSIVEDSIIQSQVQVGPFARIRPQTNLGDNSKIGNFVEVKKSTIGKHTKINHLSYIGNSTIGNQVNIGAGVITCNYDGKNKHQTIINDGAFIGSNSQLIAPVKIGKNAKIGAGSTITKDAPEQQLTLSRIKQVSVKNWQS